MSTITPPKRGEFFTPGGIPTLRFITWIESLTNQSNGIAGEVSEASELISGSSLTDELVQELETDLAMPSSINYDEAIEDLQADIDSLASQASQETQVISTSVDFTTTGTQVIICTNTADITITLNSSPDDGEEVYIKRQNTGAVTVSGAIDGDTSLAIGQRYSSPHLIFTLDANEWSII